MKRTFTVSVRLRGVDKVFAEGMEPGEIAVNEITVDSSKHNSESLLQWRLYEHGQELVKELVDVVIHEVK